jgi:DNA-binding GntR family transcriptional regulator
MLTRTEPSTDTVGETVYRRIRSDIVFGRLAPGQKLKLEQLREAYGSSVSTLRELLNRLASEGLVEAEGQKGFAVARVSATNLIEIAAMRLLLEGHALAQSFAAGDMEWEGRVVAAHHKLAQMERRMLENDHPDAELWKHYDREFHQALISACGSQVLMQTHAVIYDKYLRYQMVAVIFRGEIAADEHRRLLDYAISRDTTRAQGILAGHINGCVEHTLQTGTLDDQALNLTGRALPLR